MVSSLLHQNLICQQELVFISTRDHSIFFLRWSVALIFGFDSEQYNVSESASVVAVTISHMNGILTTDIAVHLSTMDLTAVCECFDIIYVLSMIIGFVSSQLLLRMTIKQSPST